MSGFKPSAALQNRGLQLSLAKLWGRTPPIPPAFFLESHAVTHNWQMSSVRQLGEPLSRNFSKLLLVVVSWCRFHSCLLNSGWESINWSKSNTSHKAIQDKLRKNFACLRPSACSSVSSPSPAPQSARLYGTWRWSNHSEPGWLSEPPPILLASYLNLSLGTVWGFIAGIRSRTFAGHRR